MTKNEINKNYRRRAVIRWRNEGLCTNCGHTREDKKLKTCQRCRDKINIQCKRRRKEAIESGKCRYCRRNPFKPGTAVCTICAEKYKFDPKTRRIKYLQDKHTVIKKYGGYECNCCGVRFNHIFLSVDHINNDGKYHRKTQQKNTGIYGWLIANNFPKEFQILCLNCNFAKKSNNGICPHKDPSYKWNCGDFSDEE